MWAMGYYHALCRLSVRPSYPRHSTAHNIERIMFIFGTAIDCSRNMNLIDYVVYNFIF